MCEISTTEFKNNFGKYIEIGQKEEIKVTKNGKVIFHIIPNRLKLEKQAIDFLKLLPKDASIGIDPNERG